MAKHADTVGQRLNGSPAMTDSAVASEDSAMAQERLLSAEDESTAMEQVCDGADQHETDSEDGAEAIGHQSFWSVPREIAIGAAVVVVLGGLAGWMGYRSYESHQQQELRNELVAVAQQGAVNLTTIDYTKVDADVQRILDSSTGAFHDDFQKRSQPFIDVVKKAQSKSAGTIIAAGLESQDGAQARVLVVVSVKTSTAGAPEQDPRRWRMRMDVQKIGASSKVSDVQFVP